MKSSTEAKVVIFAIYHKKFPVWNLPCVIPICTGDGFYGAEKMLRDNTGDNIASQNRNYGELTAHYWVRKNYLKEHNPEYVGFCHYRKWFDFQNQNLDEVAFAGHSMQYVKKHIKKYTYKRIYNSIKDYDLILPKPYDFAPNLMVDIHPKIKDDIFLFAKALYNVYPECKKETEIFLKSDKMIVGTVFVMKRELFEEWEDWIFPVLEEYKKITDITKYNGTYEERLCAFMYERFFNVWLSYKMKNNNIKVGYKRTYMIVSVKKKNFREKISSFRNSVIKRIKGIKCRNLTKK